MDMHLINKTTEFQLMGNSEGSFLQIRYRNFFFCKSRVLNFTPGNSAGVQVHKSIMILPFYGILSKRCCSCEEEYEQYDVYRCYLSCYLPYPVSRIAPKTVMRAPITCVVQANIAEVLLL